jgi:hypothetical protein
MFGIVQKRLIGFIAFVNLTSLYRNFKMGYLINADIIVDFVVLPVLLNSFLLESNILNWLRETIKENLLI